VNERALSFRLLLLFVFLLPLRTVEIPSIVAGFSINPARLASVLLALVLIADICINPQRWGAAEWKWPRHPYLRILVALFLLSVPVYYVEVMLGSVMKFGETDSFFRSWRGRPVGQLISLTTYALIPYLVVRRYAVDPRLRTRIERTIIACVLLLFGYGLFQQFSFYAGLPVTGRLLYEGPGEGIRVPTFSAAGLNVLRFYSLAGEPRDYGTFMVGAIPFVAYWFRRRGLRPPPLLMGSLCATLLITASTSTFLAALLALGVIGADALYHGRVRVSAGTTIALAAVLGLAAVAGAVIQVFWSRTELYWTELVALLQSGAGGVVVHEMVAQSVDLGGLFYVLNLPFLGLYRIVFGYGYGNYMTGMAGILLDRFGWNISGDAFSDTRSYLVKLLVENGLLGLLLLAALFLFVLTVSSRQIRYWQLRDRGRARQLTLLRYSYIGFFVANLIHISFFHFIVMGLILAIGAGERLEHSEASAGPATAGSPVLAGTSG
jgi:hypothetical protein